MLEANAEFCFLYTTFPDAASAHTGARALIAAKLAACVNVTAPMTSFYVWNAATEETSECAAFIKMRRADIDAAVDTLRALHPYTVPCFLVLPIEAGNADYLAWARAQTERTVIV